jgi:hypothetical protein
MKGSLVRLASGTAMLAVLSACNEDAVLIPDKDTPVMTDHGVLIRSRDDVAAIVNRELAIGASPDAIEGFFKSHNLGCTYDEYQTRYQSLSWVSRFHAITILVNVDGQGRMTGAEVRDSYTGL